MEQLLFLMQISRLHLRVYYNANFHDLKLSSTKMTVVSIKYKIRNENFFYYLFWSGFSQKVYEKNFAFQYKILKFISGSSIL